MFRPLLSEGPHWVYMAVNKADCGQFEVIHKNNYVATDFGVQARVASSCPGAAVLLYAWPHETVRQASLLLLYWGVINRGRTGTLGAVGELERTAECSRLICRSRWRP
jgi:hypothetical protein